MKIVFLSVWYSEKMGYIENCLPKAIARYGHEVHVIASTAQVYYNDPDYNSVYQPYIGSPIVQEEVKEVDGFLLHRLNFATLSGKIYLKKLYRRLKDLDPDVVQVFDAFSILTLQASIFKLFLNYKLFTANHTVASVFPLLNEKNNKLFSRVTFFLTRSIPGSLVGLLTSRCYPATIDALDIAVKYYKVPVRKVKLATLGVDTDFFYPTVADEEEILKSDEKRRKFGINDDDILCIYTGKFTIGKNPLCLAEAIERLVGKNENFKAIFLGNGPQGESIKNKPGCVVHDFVPYHELPDFYRIADIGVWPRQESTSMLDAAACGLPIVISKKVQAVERVNGNGLTYIENNIDDLLRVLLLLKDKNLRLELGSAGVNKIKYQFSWDKLAEARLSDYKLFIK